MKQKVGTFSSQIMILVLAAFIFLAMIQVAKAQAQTSGTPSWDDAMKKSFQQMGAGKNPKGIYLAQGANQNSQMTGNVARGNTLSMKMPQRSGLSKFLEKTTLSYYQQFLGPTLGGPSGQTYNIYQEGINTPRSGQAPLQSFHALNLRYQFNPDWAIGTSIAVANGYTEEVRTRDNRINSPRVDWFNARAYLSIPSLKTPIGTFFTTLAFEAPTSSISKGDDMTYGYVISENLAFNMPNMKWVAGLTGQIYRINYIDNIKRTQGMAPIQLQTLIVSGGPYLNYRFNDSWMLGSSVIMDWDQKGIQTGSREFGANLPHRARVTASYFPRSIKYLTSVGVFSQALLKYRSDTTVMGAEFGVKF